MTKGSALLSSVEGVGGRLLSAVRRLAGGHGHSDPLEDRWHAVTVNVPPAAIIIEGVLPAPLAALNESIEVRIVPAPGDKGSEIHARLLDESADADGDEDPRAELRRALRESRSLLEIGEVIEPNRNVTTEPTLSNRPVAAATQRGRGGGVL
jgi:hypothetical protein